MRLPVPLLVAALALTACGGDPDAASQTAGAAGSPVSFDNCGQAVTVDAPPERVVIMSGSAVPLLAAVDALDRVVARGGEFSGDVFDTATAEAVAQIPPLSRATTETGGVELSLEVLLEQDPDLVIGYATDTITRAALDQVGVPLIVQPGFCDGPTEPDVGFADVYDQVELYGRIFDAPDRAAAVVAGLRERVAAVERSAPAERRTAALLYLNESGGALSAYGNRGIVHDQVETAGLTNVFGEVDQRVFDIGVEELLGRDPDRIIILRDPGSDPQALEDALLAMPGADRLRAARSDAISTLIFNYGDPPTPLSVDGLELITDGFAAD